MQYTDDERRFGYQVTPERELDDGRPWYPFGLGTTPSLKAKMQAARRVRKNPFVYRRLPSAETKALVLAMIENGTPYLAHWFTEGDMESGPYGGTLVGIRWGQARLEMQSDGMVNFYRQSDSFWSPDAIIVHDSQLGYHERGYIGFGAMISNHLRALKTNLERNGAAFVITGRR